MIVHGKNIPHPDIFQKVGVFLDQKALTGSRKITQFDVILPLTSRRFE
jgi:hypothetical protein